MVTAVHHIVVQKCRRMYQLGHCRTCYGFLINATAAGLRGNECQQRSEFLARSLEQIAVDTVREISESAISLSNPSHSVATALLSSSVNVIC